MWDGVTYVEPRHDPIIHEGREAATVVINNAGPADVRIKAWYQVPPLHSLPDIDIELRRGNTRSVNACLIRASMSESDDGSHHEAHHRQPRGRIKGDGRESELQGYAALGWRVIR